MTIEELENNHPELILFKSYRGSLAFGTYEEGVSDKDCHGIYMAPLDAVLLNQVQPTIKDEGGDNFYMELGNFINSLSINNPSAMELLWAPEDCIITKNPILDDLFTNKDRFISKLLEKTLVEYSKGQIYKASGENKKINMEKKKVERKGLLDFCFTPYKQGSILFTEWLKEKGLKQEYCGLVNVPNMRYTYNVFYDIAQHIQFENLSYVDTQELIKNSVLKSDLIVDFKVGFGNGLIRELDINTYSKITDGTFKNLKYKGIVKDNFKSNQISLSSIPKGAESIATIQCNLDAYSISCKEYREYADWKAKYNRKRFLQVAVKDNGEEEMQNSKNLVHCVRNVLMGKEIGEGKGLIIRRPDYKFLLEIKHAKYRLKEIQEFCEPILKELPELFEKSGLPDKPDNEYLQNYLLTIKKEFYKIND